MRWSSAHSVSVTVFGAEVHSTAVDGLQRINISRVFMPDASRTVCAALLLARLFFDGAAAALMSHWLKLVLMMPSFGRLCFNYLPFYFYFFPPAQEQRSSEVLSFCSSFYSCGWNDHQCAWNSALKGQWGAHPCNSSPIGVAVLLSVDSTTNWLPARPQWPLVSGALNLHWANKDVRVKREASRLAGQRLITN